MRWLVGWIVALGAMSAAGAVPAWAGTPPPAAVTSTDVTATFSPASAALTGAGERFAVLRIANDGTAPINDIVVDTVQDAGVSVAVEAAPSTIPPGGSVALQVTVSRSDTAPPSTSVHARVRWTAMSAATPTAGAAVAALDLSIAAVPTAGPTAVTVTGSAGRTELVQYATTDLFFTIANTTGVPQQLDDMVVRFPSYLSVVSVSRDASVPAEGEDDEERSGSDLVIPVGAEPLGAGDARVVHLAVTADQPLQPGTALVLLEVHATDTRSGTSVTVVGSQSMTFSVLGESAVLKALALPSLLLLPGLVFVVVLWALRRFLVPGAKEPATVPLTGDQSIVMWVLALPVTLACAFLYPPLTERFLGVRRNYLTTYGIEDILYAWLLAAILALLVWLVYIALRALYVPQPNQSERRIVTAFAFRPLWGGTLTRPLVMHNNQLLAVLRTSGDRLLLSPRIFVPSERLYDPEREKFDDAVPDHPLRTLLLMRAVRKRAPAAYGAAADAGVKAPTWVNAADTRSAPEGDLVVIVAPAAGGEGLDRAGAGGASPPNALRAGDGAPEARP